MIFLGIAMPNLQAQSLQSVVQQIAKDPGYRNGSIGISVRDVESNQLLYSYQDQKTMIPASVLKILTISAALEQLGPNYKFVTQCGYEGTIRTDGTLLGDFIIVGGGDPTMGSKYFGGERNLLNVFERIVQKLGKKGITKITGNLLIDISSYGADVQGHAWAQNDLGNYYGAGIFGLNVIDNLFNIQFAQNQEPGSPVKLLQITPWLRHLQIQNEVLTGPASSGDQAYVFGSAWTNQVFIRGTIPPGAGNFTIKGAIPNPPQWFADSLLKYCQLKGIEIGGNAMVYGSSPQETKMKNLSVFDTLQSPALSDIIRIANVESVNLFCEAMLLAMDRSPENGISRFDGIEYVYSWMAANKIDTVGLFYQDGSGLSPRNGITANQLAQVLAVSAKKYGSKFEDYFAQAGSEGTVKNLLKASPHKSHFKVKSGSMDRVRNYAGFVHTDKGKWLSYSILLNDFTAKGSQTTRNVEEILEAINKL
ncbi:MAG: D-alanyl-D-alanine carboxypeptidase/D-alanyl-D-alanine-endopeptidase [Saprospiraceae bacterium]